jgi:hypothetical protein
MLQLVIPPGAIVGLVLLLISSAVLMRMMKRYGEGHIMRMKPVTEHWRSSD